MPPKRTPATPKPTPRPDDIPALPGAPGHGDEAHQLGRALMNLNADVADARARLTGAYARSYLAATGTREERTETAKQATIEEQRAYDYARAVLDGFKFEADAARWVAIDGLP